MQTLYENNFLAIREESGYYYYHMTRTDGRLVAILPHRLRAGERQYLARVEICPAHSLEPDLYAITGGVTPGEAPLEAAVRELGEEAGYHMSAADFRHLGSVRPSKQADTIADLFAVDVTGRRQRAITGDGTRWEQGASVQWVSFEQGLAIADPLFIAAMVRVHMQAEV